MTKGANAGIDGKFPNFKTVAKLKFAIANNEHQNVRKRLQWKTRMRQLWQVCWQAQRIWNGKRGTVIFFFKKNITACALKKSIFEFYL